MHNTTALLMADESSWLTSRESEHEWRKHTVGPACVQSDRCVCVCGRETLAGDF